jgi:hypothetical protein
MNLCLKVYHNHTYNNVGNVECELIEELELELGGVFRCTLCKNEIVVKIVEGAE